MIVRTGNGEVMTANGTVLLEYLGLKKGAAGGQSNLGTRFAVAGNVELIASVPFCLSAEENIKEGFAWTLSTFDLDRYQERIDPAGWDFKRYMDNPVVEWAHRYDIPAIGKMEGLTIDDKGLHGVVVFNSKEYDPFGWSIGQRVKAGVIRAGSVGFRVIEIEIPSKDDAPDGGKDGTTLIFRKQELLEFSICNVPANPFALAKSMNNEQLAMSDERGVNAIPFWNGLINNL